MPIDFYWWSQNEREACESAQLSLPRTPGSVRERGYFRPGPVVGGHCIGVDPWFLVEAALDITTLIRAARQVNDTQPGFVKEENHFV